MGISVSNPSSSCPLGGTRNSEISIAVQLVGFFLILFRDEGRLAFALA